MHCGRISALSTSAPGLLVQRLCVFFLDKAIVLTCYLQHGAWSAQNIPCTYYSCIDVPGDIAVPVPYSTHHGVVSHGCAHDLLLQQPAGRIPSLSVCFNKACRNCAPCTSALLTCAVRGRCSGLTHSGRICKSGCFIGQATAAGSTSRTACPRCGPSVHAAPPGCAVPAARAFISWQPTRDGCSCGWRRSTYVWAAVWPTSVASIAIINRIV